jgi:hypothetical protein
VLDGEEGSSRSCEADLWARQSLLQVDVGGKAGSVLVRQVAVGSCRGCFFTVLAWWLLVFLMEFDALVLRVFSSFVISSFLSV